jgi:hypothetical protein
MRAIAVGPTFITAVGILLLLLISLLTGGAIPALLFVRVGLVPWTPARAVVVLPSSRRKKSTSISGAGYALISRNDKSAIASEFNNVPAVGVIGLIGRHRIFAAFVAARGTELCTVTASRRFRPLSASRRSAPSWRKRLLVRRCHQARSSRQPRSSTASRMRSRLFHQITAGRLIPSCQTGRMIRKSVDRR